MKTKLIAFAIFVLLLNIPSITFAVLTLQVGAPAGTGDAGIYADYTGLLSNPTEEDTAVTGGNTILVAAAYGPNDVFIGGKGSIGVHDWSYFGFDPLFDGKGALLMATIEDGTLGAGTLSISLDGGTTFSSHIYSTGIYEDGFEVPNPPSNHDPIKNQDYLFFDIGSFSQSIYVPNFDSEETGSQLGEIKSIQISTSGYDWIHFDVFALVTDQTGTNKIKTNTDDEGNPGSHDVTRKVPEPSTLLLLGSGLVALGVIGRRKLQ